MSCYITTVASANARLSFCSEIDLYDHFTRQAPMSYVPEMKVQRDNAAENYQVEYTDSPDNYLEFTSRRLVIKYPWQMMNSGEALLTSAYPLIELQRQQSHSLTAHSACVTLPEGGVLLLGKEGSGKSSLALQLCLSRQAKLVANDLCILSLSDNELMSLGGTKFFFLRYESMRRSMPQLLRFFPSVPEEPWLAKVKVTPDELGITSASIPARVKQTYIVHIDETKSDVFVVSGDNLVNRLYLYENFSRYIRSSCTVMLGNPDLDFLGYIPSLDSPKLYAFRIELIRYLLQNLAMRYVSGPLEPVAAYIANNM